MNEPIIRYKLSMYSLEIKSKHRLRKKTHKDEDDFGKACNFLQQLF